MAFVFKSVPLTVKLLGPATDPTHVFAKLVMVVAFKTGVVADDTVHVRFTSSIPMPWSLPMWLESSHFNIKNSLFANVKPGMEKLATETLLAAAFPSKVPAVDNTGVDNVRPVIAIQPLGVFTFAAKLGGFKLSILTALVL